MGHRLFRLAKTALLAAARDERFAVCAFPNQTGGGGVPLAKRDFGENVSTEMSMFHHWYCKAYGKYIDNEQAMKFDQHLLVAAIAPRRILVQGFNQGWFDTKGEFLALPRRLSCMGAPSSASACRRVTSRPTTTPAVSAPTSATCGAAVGTVFQDTIGYGCLISPTSRSGKGQCPGKPRSDKRRRRL